MKYFIISKNPFIAVYDNVMDVNLYIQNYESLQHAFYTYDNLDRSFFKPGQSPKLFNYFFDNGKYQDESFRDIFPSILSSLNLITQTNLNPNTLSAQVNVSDFSVPDMMHVDFGEKNKAGTVLHYANVEWDLDFGGETLFYDHKNLEIIAAIKPSPGRFVIFDGSIPHSARPPQVHCPYKRYTIAVKFLSLDLFLKN
jgi:hypothetical protein